MPLFRLDRPLLPSRAYGHARAAIAGAFIIALSAAGLSPAGAAAPAIDAAKDPVGIWTGTLVVDRGICPETRAPSTLQIESKRIAFTPADGVHTLRGQRDGASGPLHAQLVLSDMNRKPFPMVFEGTPDGAAIQGTYGTPRCRAHVVLTRPQSRAMEHFMGH
ncbi:hypothetical protein ACMAUO_00500 [Gluconacetobacter sp. Hr-1-5]|uniref:hypothetical protein n=1 Tax=Gluconacetobacter sp. Hr-1-5 TaxID=3395370 RepID=UPI003B51A594